MDEATRHAKILIRNTKWNPKWKKGDPLETKDQHLNFGVPEDAIGAEVRVTEHGYCVYYEQLETKELEQSSQILKIKMQRVIHTERYFNMNLEQDFVRFLYTDFAAVADHAGLPADYKAEQTRRN